MKTPAVQRQADNLIVADLLAERAGLGVEQEGSRGNFHLGVGGAKLEFEIDAASLADYELDTAPHRGLESRRGCTHSVSARVERCDYIVARVVGHHLSRNIGGLVFDGDASCWNGGFVRVVYGSHDAPSLHLREGG